MPQTPYSLPEIYEIAFSFRDYLKTVDSLTNVFTSITTRDLKSVVELGCGPGQYCREFAKKNIKATGIDLSREMIAYDREMAIKENLNCEFLEGDMRSFCIPQKADLAICMMATIHLLLTNEDMIENLNSVADNLVSDGFYIIEMSHPRDFFSQEPGTGRDWEMERDGIKVHTDWGSDAVQDATNEINTGTVSYKVTREGKTEEFKAVEKWRDISHGHMLALIESSGRYKTVKEYGDLDPNIPFSNDKKSWRMIFVLQRVR